MANPAKEKKNKERDETGILLRRLVDEMTVLRGEVESLKAAQHARKSSNLIGKTANAHLELETNDLATGQVEQIADGVEDIAVARLADAFCSPQKVKIVRILLTEGPLSSAQVGERTGLTTGSLYHHLRELVHAEVIEQTSRNLHSVTPLGRRTALSLFHLAK
jgi:hypothetical protein